MNAEEKITEILERCLYHDAPSLAKAILSIDPKELIKYSFCGTVEYPTVNIEWKE